MDRRQFLQRSVPAGLSISVSGCIEIFTSPPESSSEPDGRADSGPAGGTTNTAIPARLYNVETNSTTTDPSGQPVRTATIEAGSPTATATERPHRTATRTAEPPSPTPTPEPATASPTPTPSNGGTEQLEIIEHGLYEDFSTGVRGTVVNNADHTFDYVEVTVWFRDSEGTLIGDGLANTLDLGAGEKWLFKALFMGTDPGAIDHYDIKVSGDLI